MKFTNNLSIFVSLYIFTSLACAADMPPPPPMLPPSLPQATDVNATKAVPAVTIQNVPQEDLPPSPPSVAAVPKPQLRQLSLDGNISKNKIITADEKVQKIEKAQDTNDSIAKEKKDFVVVPKYDANISTPTLTDMDSNVTILNSILKDNNVTSQGDLNITILNSLLKDDNTTRLSDANITKTFPNGKLLDVITITRDANLSSVQSPEDKRLSISAVIEREDGDDAKAPVVIDKGEIISVNLQELDISEFVKMVSRIIGKNILLTQPISGKVDFITNGPVYKSALLPILTSVLDSKGFAMVANDDFMQIVRNSEASRYNLPIGKDIYGLGQMTTEIVKAKSENVDLMASKIRPYMSMAGKLTTTKETNSMLITDYPDNIKTIRKLIKALELSSKMEVDFVRLKHIKLATVAPNLQRIVQSITNPRIDSEKVELIQDVGTNTFIVVANRKNIEIVRQIVGEMDTIDNLMEQQIHVIPIKNADAKQIMPAITGIVGTKIYTAPNVKPSISSDDTTNSIIVVGTRADVNEIKSIVDVLDREKQQVYIVAKIMEISDSKARSIGVKYGFEGGKVTANGLFSFAANLGGPSFSVSSALASFIKPSNITEGIALGASLSFLGTEGAANIVSEPTILCIDNKESTIFVGETVSLLTSTVAGTSSTDLARSTFARESIGLTLKVKPRISNDQKVNMTVSAKLEDVKPGSGGDGRPNTTKREVTTEIIVSNGEAAIIGGLITDKQTNAVSKIPFLGDIPILGYAFKEDVQNTDNTNLVIVLTPYVIPKSSDLTTLRERLRELNDLQERFTKEISEKLKKNRR